MFVFPVKGYITFIGLTFTKIATDTHKFKNVRPNNQDYYRVFYMYSKYWW